MLKIKEYRNVSDDGRTVRQEKIDFKELDNKFDLETETYIGDYWDGTQGDIEHFKDGVFISEVNRIIYGIDNSDLELLYDLIKADLVEKVGN